MNEFEPFEEPEIPELIPSLDERLRTLERVNQALARARALLERVNQMEKRLKATEPEPELKSERSSRKSEV